MKTAEERFWVKVNKDGVGGCWNWKGTIGANGYGRFQEGKFTHMAHRLSYELLVGKIPDELTIDHLCQNKGCVNPKHLEQVTRGENARRWSLARTGCKQGHLWTPENTFVDKRGKRNCRTCQRVWEHKSRKKRNTLAAYEKLKGKE